MSTFITSRVIKYSAYASFGRENEIEFKAIFENACYEILKQIREGIFTISILLKRKLLTAMVSSLIFTLIFSMFGGFNINGFFSLFYLNMMFALTYGVLASFFSDWLSKDIFKKPRSREIASFILHFCCGAVFQVFGIVSATVFYIVDRLLKKVKISWLTVIIAFLIVVAVFVIMINIET